MADGFKVVMESDEFGRDRFGPYDTLKEALEAIGRLHESAIKQNDGVERVIGILVNEEEDEG